MVKIQFLGACQEVGRSGVLIESEITGDAVLMDYGVKMNEQTEFPEHIRGKNLSALVLTHSHIDHCGAIPLFYISGSVPLYCTELTFRISEILLQDMLNITQNYLPFEKPELIKMEKYASFLNYGERKKIGKQTFITLLNAGHIPGSAMVVVEMDGKTVLYTGDINTTPTQLINSVDPKEIPALDAIIIESTYGTTDHPARAETEDQFIQFVSQIIDKNGVVLTPAFGVARSQEIMMVLHRDGINLPFPIVIDGMARKIALVYEKFPNMLRKFDEFKGSINKSRFIVQYRPESERKQASSKPGIIIAPSGMLKGGTARYYMDTLLDDSKNAITLVSYQIEGTPGKILMDQHVYMKDNIESSVSVNAQVQLFDFSSHAGKSDLVNFLAEIQFTGEKNVYCVHGDQEVMASFAQELTNLGYHSETPSRGQIFHLS